MESPRLISLASLVLGLALATSAHAQYSMEIDPSIRATGMGGASGAVFWDATNEWANPALLGYQQGLRYDRGSTRLGPSTVDISFESEAWSLGAYGLGFSSSGNPIGRLDLLNGGSRKETVESWGFGVNAVELTEHVVRWFGGEMPHWSRFADISIGMNTKHLVVNDFDGPAADAHARDFGVLARFTPINRPVGGDGLPFRVDLAYGYSALSHDATLDWASWVGGGTTPVRSHYINAATIRTTLDGPQTNPRQGLLGWFMTGLAPLASLSLAYDHRLEVGLLPMIPGYGSYEMWGGGAELTLLNCVTLRAGLPSNRTGNVPGETLGLGLALPLGRGAGIRYDWASYPNPSWVPSAESTFHREGFTAWLDLREAVKAARGE